MSWPTIKMALRLRWVSTASGGLGLIAVLIVVGALFPAVGHTIGKLNIPKGVSQLLGGADYGTITGWYRSEIGSIYGPLVIGGLAIAGAVAATAGEEEDRILALVLAHPIRRARLIAAKAAAIVRGRDHRHRHLDRTHRRSRRRRRRNHDRAHHRTRRPARLLRLSHRSARDRPRRRHRPQIARTGVAAAVGILG